MPDFKDAKGDRWDVAITGGTIKRCLDKLGVDLGRPLIGDDPPLTRFQADLAFRVDVIYVICLPEAEGRGLEAEAFAERLGGETLYAASQAVLEAWALFFRSLRRPEGEAIDQAARVETEIYDVAAAHFSGPGLAAALDREVESLRAELLADLQSRNRPGG